MDPNTQFGPYTLVKKLASGGMAEIFLARAGGIQGFEKYLVLKMIHPKWGQDDNFIKMLVEEAKLAVTLNHANIAQIFDLGRHNDIYYIAMEYVDGRDLFQMLVRTSERDTYLPFDVTAYIAEQVAAALSYAHSRADMQGRSLNLIHRDVSPQNIIISMNGEVKLIDFGIAKATMRPGTTQVGIIKGKFYYMSPEQAWGRPMDHRSDIFSLGICLHEMLTGQMLYAEDDQLRLLEKVRAADIPRPSQMRGGIPPELEAITMRALAVSPDQRFQTAFEFQRALTGYLHHNAPGFTPTRGARTMWDLFPEATSLAQQSVQAQSAQDNVMKGHDFAAVRPPESVIFDVSQAASMRPRTGDPAPPPPVMAGPPRRDRRATTTPAASAESGQDVMTGDNLGRTYPLSGSPRASHPPPPLARNSPKPNIDATQSMSWNNIPAKQASSGGLRRASSPPPVSNNDEATAMFNPATMGPPPGPPPQLRKASTPPKAGQGASAPIRELDADERTMMFRPDEIMSKAISSAQAAPPKATPAPAPPPVASSNGLRKASAPTATLEAADRTTLFDPSLYNAPSHEPAKPPAPAPKPPGLRKKSDANKALSKASEEAAERTTLFDPSMMPSAEESPVDDAPVTEVKAETAPADGDDKKPMTREEKIAAAKARAKAGNDDLASRIKKKKAQGSDGDDKKPMTREEKIAAAKARAKAGNDDLASRIKKKKAQGSDDDDPKPMTREEKIAAAKARAKGGDDLASRIKKKKPGAAAKAKSSRDDPMADRIKQAKAKAKKKAGAGAGKPNRVQSKGNNNVRVAGRNTVLGVDANTTLGKTLRFVTHPITLGTFALFFIGCALTIAYAVIELTKPPPPEFSSIEVTSTPPGAKIEYDGVDLGAPTPFVIDNVPIGSIHSLRVSKDEYVPEMRTNISVQSNELESVHFVLKPSPGTLIVSSDPPEADVIINGETKDVTPCTIEDLQRQDGTFVEILIRKNGFRDHIATLKWEGSKLKMSHHADLEPADDE